MAYRPFAEIGMATQDDEMMSLDATLRFFGGDKPIHYSTLYRGIAAGRYAKPVHIGPNTVRWLRSECQEARKKMMEERDACSVPSRRRGPKRKPPGEASESGRAA
jgi:predicted DNA-binding transcriptional regulator AlpA